MKRPAVLLILAMGPALPVVVSVLGGLAASAPDDRVYVGEQQCRSCHPAQFSQWRMTKHAQGYATLSMPESKEIAILSGVTGDPHDSPICLGCHTTASGAEEWELDDTFFPEDGVQCELCHGPGSAYGRAEIMRDSVLSAQAGLRFMKERDCLVCHREKASHTAVLEVRPFVYAEAVASIAHPGKAVVEPLTEGAGVVDAADGGRYAGVFACVPCHGGRAANPVFGKWRSSFHARAYAVLGTPRGREIAGEMGVTGDPQRSATCLSCHATGGDAPAEALEPGFNSAQGVQCESCHGPGSGHIEEARSGDAAEGRVAGLRAPDREVCEPCHQNGIHGYTFEFEAMWPQVNHSKWQEPAARPAYKTPFNLALTPDGKRLLVVCEAANTLMILDAATGAIQADVAVGLQPHFVTLSPDGSVAYVSNRGSDNVSVVDLAALEVVTTLPAGDEPHEMATNPAGTLLYVANAGTYDVSVVDVASGTEAKRLAASRGTWGIAPSPDGKELYVTNNLPRFAPFREPASSEVTVIETGKSTVRHRYAVEDANLIQGVAVAPAGDFALVTLIRTKNLVPMTRNLQGWIITNGLGILWPDGRVDQVLLDRMDDGFADPTDIVISQNGKTAYVSGGGVREVAVVDVDALKRLLQNATPRDRAEVLPNHLGLSLEFVTKRIPVGESPRGMVLSPDGRLLYVADGLDDTISVIDVEKLERVRVLDLGGPKEITQTRYGERIFHRADQTYARQFSCHSCHPDGHIDGITYDIEPDGLGLNPVDNRTLRGINDTAPYKWTGTNPTLKRQCGPRLSAFFTRSDPFNAEQAAALDRFIVTIPRPPNRYRQGAELTDAQRRGKQLFERSYDKANNLIPLENRCSFCHPAPYYTRREVFGVASASPLDTHDNFDIPHLNNIYDSPPYLHDGRAKSLEEIWTLYNPDDTHGVTNDLTKNELNDLIEFLKTL